MDSVFNSNNLLFYMGDIGAPEKTKDREPVVDHGKVVGSQESRGCGFENGDGR